MYVHIESLELELEVAVVSHLTWMLGIRPSVGGARSKDSQTLGSFSSPLSFSFPFLSPFFLPSFVLLRF